MGEVIFIGGGSGDPGLVTVAGALALKKAEIVFYDRLVNPLLLLLTNAQATLVDVGKLPGSTIHGQVEISKQLLQAQAKYTTVVRLKGGDSGVFGRLDEELTTLKQQGKPFRIIPGITAALSLGAYSSISLTKRAVSRGLTIITGHQVDETQSVLDHLVQQQTLIIYMGVHTIPAIQAKLLTRFPKDLPVLIGQQVSLSNQRLVTTTLARLTETVTKAQIKNPALFLFGDVAKDYDRAQNWLTQQPLLGQRWLLFTKHLNYEAVLRYTELGADVWPISNELNERQKFHDLTQNWLNGPRPQGIILKDGLSKSAFQALDLKPDLATLPDEDETTFFEQEGNFLINRTFRVGTRGSRLALAQTQEVIDRLQKLDATLDFKIIPIKTKGDLKPNVALTKLGSNGLFVREVEMALLHQDIDFAVHSAKDLPAQLASELTICATPPRALAYDVLVLKDKQIQSLAQLPKGATIATGSPRRVSLLTRLRPDLQFQNIRGNVPTRLHKLETLAIDGIVLAAAGLQRLNLLDPQEVHYLPLAPEVFVPAPGQGILALEARRTDTQVQNLLQRINDGSTYRALQCERAYLKTLDGDCTIPLGCHSTLAEDQTMTATAFLGDKADRFKGQLCQKTASLPQALGVDLAQTLRQALAEV